MPSASLRLHCPISPGTGPSAPQLPGGLQSQNPRLHPSHQGPLAPPPLPSWQQQWTFLKGWGLWLQFPYLPCSFRRWAERKGSDGGKSGSQSASLKVAAEIQARGGAGWERAVAGEGGGQTEGFYGGRAAGSLNSPTEVREKEELGIAPICA